MLRLWVLVIIFSKAFGAGLLFENSKEWARRNSLWNVGALGFGLFFEKLKLSDQTSVKKVSVSPHFEANIVASTNYYS